MAQGFKVPIFFPVTHRTGPRGAECSGAEQAACKPLLLLEAGSEFMPQAAVCGSEPAPSASDGYKKATQPDVHLSKYITEQNDFSLTKLIKNGTKQ